MESMRLRFRPLAHWRELSSIAAVTSAMKLSPEISDRLVRWENVYFESANQLERANDGSDGPPDPPVGVYWLGRARSAAEAKLLGAEYPRYRHLMAADENGRLDEELTLETHPRASSSELISTSEHHRSGKPIPTEYVRLFR